MENSEAMIADKLLRMQLHNARKARGLSQQDVSNLSGLSVSCISNIESGEDSSPTLRSLIKYCSALGIEMYIGMDTGKSKVDQTVAT
jgi:transcriptional regulator with XRE-family HTH domain